jgi:hypothetical protein
VTEPPFLDPDTFDSILAYLKVKYLTYQVTWQFEHPPTKAEGVALWYEGYRRAYNDLLSKRPMPDLVVPDDISELDT